MIQKCIPIIFLAGLILGLAQISLAGEVKEEQVSAWRLETQGWTIADHMATAKKQEQVVESLESRIQEVEKRIANFVEKPYFDPKGFKRTSLQHVAENLKGKMNLLNERVAWHYKQADQAKLTE